MSSMDEAVLLKMAEAEILGEAKRAAVRHSTAGVSGWQPGPKANKLFLANMLLQTMASNRILARKQNRGESKINKKKSERKLQNKQSGSNFIFKKPKKDSKIEYLSNKKTKKTKDPRSANVKKVSKKPCCEVNITKKMGKSKT